MANDQTPRRRATQGPGAPLGDGEQVEPLKELMLRRSKLSTSEAALLRRVFPSLIHAHYHRLWAQLQRRGVPVHEVKDLLQETFLGLFNRILEKGYPSDLSLKLNQILKGTLLNRARHRSRHPESIGLPSSGSEPVRSSQDLTKVLDRHALAAELLSALSPQLRVVVEAVILQGMSHREACKALEIDEGTLKWRLEEAKRAMYEHASRLLPPSQRGAR